MIKPRIITSNQFIIERTNSFFPDDKLTKIEDKIGKVLWYETREHRGIIIDDAGNEYLFSQGHVGHIGVSCSNYVTGKLGYVLEGQLVKFTSVDYNGTLMALDIRDFLE